MKIYEVHRKVENNVGDFYCNPSRYFKFENLESGELMHNQFEIKDQTLIVGGGGLIHKKFSLHIEKLLNKKPKHTIIWGIGHNFGKKHIEKTKGKVFYPDFLDRCDLVGVRDYIDQDRYLPCVTCMHPAFDKKYTSTRDFVFYTHDFKSKFIPRQNDPHMTNKEMDFQKVIDFLGSADTVITDSYHGAYWGLLLGKDVRIISWSVKFNYFKHQPSIIQDHITTWATTKPSSAPVGYLQECRDLNINFYNKTLDIIYQ